MMITDLQYLEELRRILDVTIPRNVGIYAKAVAEGTDRFNYHRNFIVSQAPNWMVAVQTLLSNSVELARFQQRYPDWTTAELNGLIASLTNIHKATRTYLTLKHPEINWPALPGALTSGSVSGSITGTGLDVSQALAALKAVLSAEVKFKA